MPRLTHALACTLALLVAVPLTPARAIDAIIDETVKRYVDRFEECRGRGIDAITACYRDWVSNDVAAEMVKCIGADRIPKSIDAAQRDCIWMEVSSTEEAEMGAF